MHQLSSLLPGDAFQAFERFHTCSESYDWYQRTQTPLSVIVQSQHMYFAGSNSCSIIWLMRRNLFLVDEFQPFKSLQPSSRGKVTTATNSAHRFRAKWPHSLWHYQVSAYVNSWLTWIYNRPTNGPAFICATRRRILSILKYFHNCSGSKVMAIITLVFMHARTKGGPKKCCFLFADYAPFEVKNITNVMVLSNRVYMVNLIKICKKICCL